MLVGTTAENLESDPRDRISTQASKSAHEPRKPLASVQYGLVSPRVKAVETLL